MGIRVSVYQVVGIRLSGYQVLVIWVSGNQAVVIRLSEYQVRPAAVAVFPETLIAYILITWYPDNLITWFPLLFNIWSANE